MVYQAISGRLIGIYATDWRMSESGYLDLQKNGKIQFDWWPVLFYKITSYLVIKC